MPRGDFISQLPPAGDGPHGPSASGFDAGAEHDPLAPPDMSDLLDGLTPSQKRAVETTEGPLLVLAGPGSGKTRVITRRIAYLMRQGVRPWQILALTFTNKAAQEMRHRVEQLIGTGAHTRGLTVTTFHSLCVRLLRRYCEMGGLSERGVLKPEFVVYDADDQQKLIKDIIGKLQLSTTNWPPRSVGSAISTAKNDLLDAEQYASMASDFSMRTVARVYTAYQNALRSASAADFDDLLLLTARMLRDSAEVREELRRRYRYILVDEYQDTNRAQFVIASLLAGEDPKAGQVPELREQADKAKDPPLAPPSGRGLKAPNICAVGDPDQSIYGWRGADITNILQFEQRYPSAQVIALGENFRSRAPILTAADRLIQRNKQRKHKPLTPTRGQGEKIEIVLTRDEHAEARLVVDWVRKLKERGPTPGAPASAPSADAPLPPALSWKDFAVFYRTNALSRVIEDAFRAASIPYTLVRGTAFFQREEIRNATGYLRVLANPADSVSLERVINTPARGISDATWEKIVDHAAITGASTMDVCRSIEQVPGLTTRAVASVQKFTQMLDDWAGAHVKASEFMGASGDKPRGNLRELVDRVIKESGLDRFYEKEDERRENLAELVSSAAEFEQEWQSGNRDDLSEQELSDASQATKPGTTLDLLRAYLEKIALVADSDAIDPAIGAVTLMTLHAAKGLEYPCVAMIGLEEMVLPHSRAQESEAALEEERRLCFVGVTRAMERLLITSSRFRTVRGLSERTIPSRFLEELRGPETTISDQSGSLAGNDDFDDDNADGHFGEDDGDAGGGGGLRGSSRSGGSRSGPAPFSPGQRVRHPQFGVGTVKHYSGGTNAKVQVDFPGMGTKTLIVEYARLTPA